MRFLVQRTRFVTRNNEVVTTNKARDPQSSEYVAVNTAKSANKACVVQSSEYVAANIATSVTNKARDA